MFYASTSVSVESPGSIGLLLQNTDEFGILGEFANLPAGEVLPDALGDTLTNIERVCTTDFDDKIYGAAMPTTIFMGAGNDKFDTARDPNVVDTVYGEAGNDVIFGGGGNDFVDGGDGNDDLVGEGGADRLIGGAGSDTVNYATGTSGVTVPLSKVDGDGINGIPGTPGLVPLSALLPPG